MKKLLALAILSTVSLAEPCFGIGFIKDRIYSSFSTNSVAIGYHCTDSIKISVEPAIFVSNVINAITSTYLLQQLKQEQEQEQQRQQLQQIQKQQLEQQQLAQQRLKQQIQQIQQQQLEQQLSDLSSKGKLGILVNLHYHYKFTKTDITPYISAGIGTSVNMKSEYNFSYKISTGVNLPLSSRTNVFAGYHLLKESKNYNHGLEFGVNFNL